MHVTEGRHTTLHEDQRTEELFNHGLNHVRGGVYVMSTEILHLGLQINGASTEIFVSSVEKTTTSQKIVESEME